MDTPHYHMFEMPTSRPSDFAPTGLTPRQMREHAGVSRYLFGETFYKLTFSP